MSSLKDVALEIDACLGRLPFAMDVDVTALVHIASHQNLLDAENGTPAPDLPSGWERRKNELRTLMGMKPKKDTIWCTCGRPSLTCRAVERHDTGADYASGTMPELVVCATIFNDEKGLDPMELEAAFFSSDPDEKGRVRASVWSLMHATAESKRMVQEFLPAAQAAIVLSAGVTALEKGATRALGPILREFLGYLGEVPGGQVASRSLLEAYASLPDDGEGPSEVWVWSRCRLGDMLQRDGRFAAAVDSYKAAVAAVVGSPVGAGDRVANARGNLGTFWINMGTAYMRGGHLGMSEKSLRSCLAWCGESEGDKNRQRISAMGHYHLACVYEEMGRHGEARDERIRVFRHIVPGADTGVLVNAAMDRPRAGAVTAGG